MEIKKVNTAALPGMLAEIDFGVDGDYVLKPGEVPLEKEKRNLYREFSHRTPSKAGVASEQSAYDADVLGREIATGASYLNSTGLLLFVMFRSLSNFKVLLTPLKNGTMSEMYVSSPSNLLFRLRALVVAPAITSKDKSTNGVL